MRGVTDDPGHSVNVGGDRRPADRAAPANGRGAIHHVVADTADRRRNLLQPAGRPEHPAALRARGNRLGRLGAFVLVVQKSRSGMADSGVPRDKYKFEPNRKYHVRVLRDKTRLSVTVNGEHVLTEFVVAGEAPVLTLSNSWGEAGDPIYFDDIEVRAPEAVVAERKLLDRFEAWCDEYLVRELVAEKIDRDTDLLAADKQFLKAQLPTFTENPATILTAVSEAVYRQHPTPEEAAVTLRQAVRVTELDPGNCTGLSVRGLAEYRAGRYDAAGVTLKTAHEVHTRTDGSAAPWPLASLALLSHKQGRPDEARVWLRRAKDLVAGEGWTNDPGVGEVNRRSGSCDRPAAGSGRGRDPQGGVNGPDPWLEQRGPGGVPVRVRGRRPGDQRTV